MDISSDEMSYETCPTFASIEPARNVAPDVKPHKGEKVKQYRRSRFDEIENYKQVGHVGSGGFGNCFLLQKRSNMTLRVCKVQKRSENISEEPLEIEILRDILCDHPRIVRLHEAITHTHKMQLYFDYYPGGDLFGIIARYHGMQEFVPEPFIWHTFLQLSEALAYIHHGYDRRVNLPVLSWESIIHGDIKPENIFLGPPTADSHGYPSIILGDFGLATIDERPVCGTWLWQPPELPISSKKADCWALGSVIHALAHDGRPPLGRRPEGMDPFDFYRWPAARQPTSLLGAYSTELHNIVIHGALQFNPEARYSSLEILYCVIDEVELGVASDMGLEPLIDSDLATKTFDENGVTEKTLGSLFNDTQQMDTMDLCTIRPTVYHEPMDCAPC